MTRNQKKFETAATLRSAANEVFKAMELIQPQDKKLASELDVLFYQLSKLGGSLKRAAEAEKEGAKQ